MLRDLEIDSIVTFGTYEQNGNFDGKKEPIEWIVIDKNDDGAFLLSKKVLDCAEFDSTGDVETRTPYEDNYIQTHWDNSSIRFMLNEEFYNRAFNSEEKKLIIDTTTTPYIYEEDFDDDDSDMESLEDDYEDKINDLKKLRDLQGKPTVDKVVILSAKELEYYKISDLGFEPQPTDYAIKMGINCRLNIDGTVTCKYWTRTLEDCFEVYVADGCGIDGTAHILDESLGIRPAIWVNFD